MSQERYALNKQLAQRLKGGVIMDVTTPEQAKKMASVSDGAIVGSAIVKIVAKYGKECIPEVERYVKEMKAAVEI